MNFIERLLEGVEVEWKALGEVVLPTSNIQWRETNKSYQYIDLTSVCRETNTIIETTEITKDNAPIRAKKLILKDDVIFATTRPTQQRICLIVDEYTNEVVSTGYCVLRANSDVVSPKWIYFWVTSNKFKNYVEENQRGSAYPAISDTKVKEYQIPIPPLKIQKEIVRILDAFTELTAELTARKRQYEHYRERLLTFEEDEVEWKALGEVGELVRGSGLQKKDLREIGVPAIHYGQIFTRYGLSAIKPFSFVENELANKLRTAGKNDLLIATTSENDEGVLKPLAWLGGPVAISGDMMIFRHSQDVKYLAYYFQTRAFQKGKQKFITGTKVRRVSTSSIAKLLVPIPPLTIQKEIVRMLDKFETLTTSIEEGLPKEIALRQKQYEYYRDLLLTFPKNNPKV